MRFRIQEAKDHQPKQGTTSHLHVQHPWYPERTCDRNFQAAGAPDMASSARNDRTARSPAPSSSHGVAAAAAAPVHGRQHKSSEGMLTKGQSSILL